MAFFKKSKKIKSKKCKKNNRNIKDIKRYTHYGSASPSPTGDVDILHMGNYEFEKYLERKKRLDPSNW